MSDFLLIAPQGWTQLDWNAIRDAVPDLNKGNVENWVSTSQFGYIEELLKGGSFIAETMTVQDAKLIDDTYFLVQLV